MSTTSPNFNLVLATTSDTVNVTAHIANNFSSLDTIIGIAHTGTGGLKANLTITTPTITSPTMSGTVSGGTYIATTGNFATITATGGILSLTSMTAASVVVTSMTAIGVRIGTYSMPATLGSSGQVLTVSGTTLIWA